MHVFEPRPVAAGGKFSRWGATSKKNVHTFRNDLSQYNKRKSFKTLNILNKENCFT